jgi:rare lipoprotein A
MRRGYVRLAIAGAALLVAALLAGCGGSSAPVVRDGPGKQLDFSRIPDAVPQAEPRSRGGNAASYVVFGQRYHTLPSSRGYRSRGIASWYGSKFHGRKTANGEIYDMYAMTAAHRQLPIPTYVEVTNLENGRRIIVRVNDRGPFHDNRVIDLSYAAAGRLGMLEKGTALVEVRAIDPSGPMPAHRLAAQTGAPTPRIFLQAGAFRDAGNASRLREQLRRQLARDVRIEEFMTDTGPLHRVQIGPVESVEQADQLASQMHTLGLKSPVVVID